MSTGSPQPHNDHRLCNDSSASRLGRFLQLGYSLPDQWLACLCPLHSPDLLHGREHERCLQTEETSLLQTSLWKLWCHFWSEIWSNTWAEKLKEEMVGDWWVQGLTATGTGIALGSRTPFFMALLSGWTGLGTDSISLGADKILHNHCGETCLNFRLLKPV